MKSKEPFFTVFTPVYNGEKSLHRVFESLLSQDFRDFEWIIVNDGSTDNSSALIRSFIDGHPEMDIVFLEQGNAGKHIAWNNGVKYARGTLFVPADADDSFFDDTLSFYYNAWTALTPAMQKELSGINVLCYDNDAHSIVGTPYPSDGMITTNLELEYKYKIKGEKWGCIRTDIIKSIQFPYHISHSYFPEDFLWLQISKDYKVICFNKPLRRYYTSESGITQTLRKTGRNRKQLAVNIRFKYWIISNFGLYILFHSPVKFFRYSAYIILNSYVFLKKQ